MTQEANPMLNIHYYGIAREAVQRALMWFNDYGFMSCRAGVSGDKSARAVINLLAKEPQPFIDYLYGLSRLKRIQINGKGTKKEPYYAVWCEDYFKDM